MSDHVKIMAILAARPDKAEELRALLDSMLAPSRAEAGNLHYDLWQDQTNPDRFVLDELYADQEAIAAHRATPHFQTLPLGYQHSRRANGLGAQSRRGGLR